MAVTYCHTCDRLIDLDWDVDHEEECRWEVEAPHDMNCNCAECDPVGVYRREGKGGLVDD